MGVLGCYWLCGFCAQKSISPRHIVCLLVERLISLGVSLGSVFWLSCWVHVLPCGVPVHLCRGCMSVFMVGRTDNLVVLSSRFVR
ncbi:hypothetical protein HMPREF0742_00649 [Rothia aeria F0184]|uniref:Uncharacterized protein n=1 Tax=Rothia aeria F0184 TaxID=888019 RepID=U7V7C9_9MICC|nr:hypothetical protein HMPREF0742_00649 [Rothia aeria F0184]